MYSFAFPSMLGSVSSKIIEDKEAIRSNVLLLLESERKTLFGDPYFGCKLKRILFEQSTSLISDLVIDELYTSLVTFIPQIFLTRKDITLTCDGTDIYATVKYVIVLDNTVDLYTIKLTENQT